MQVFTGSGRLSFGSHILTLQGLKGKIQSFPTNCQIILVFPGIAVCVITPFPFYRSKLCAFNTKIIHN